MIVVDPQPHMTYQPFLPEAAAGNISPRHAVVPLRRELRRCRVLSGEVTHDRARPQDGDGPADRRAAARDRVRPHRRRAGLGVPHAADPRPARARASASRPSARPSTCATTCSTGSTSRPPPPTRRPAQARADLRLRRRRLRRHRGARPRWRTWPATRCVLPGARAAEDMHWVLVEATQRDPARGRPRHGRVHRRSSCSSASIDIRLGTRLESCVDGVGRALRRRRASPPTPSCGRPASSRSRCSTAPTCRATTAGRVTCLPTLQVVDADGTVRRRRVERRRLRRACPT